MNMPPATTPTASASERWILSDLHISWSGDMVSVVVAAVQIYRCELNGRSPHDVLPDAIAALAAFVEARCVEKIGDAKSD